MSKNNKTIFKNISELSDSIREKIYSHRLSLDESTPIDEYMDRFKTVLVDDCLYFASDNDSMYILERYKQLEHNGISCGKTYLPNVIIKDGHIIKNRFGTRTSDIFDSYIELKESYRHIENEIDKRCDDWLTMNSEKLGHGKSYCKLSRWCFLPNQEEPRKVIIFYSYQLNEQETRFGRTEVPIDELV